jgi:uncharacterized protein GlcG (DUF336 family)
MWSVGQACGALMLLASPAGLSGQTTAVLTAESVQAIVSAASSSVNSETLAIAVTDRQGNVLAIYHKNAVPATVAGNFSTQTATDDVAIGLARTAAFFSNNQAPLSSRTVRFISGIHFPPTIAYTSNGPLYGIENTNRGCSLNVNYLSGQALPPATALDGTSPGTGIVTGKKDLLDSDLSAVNPGGVPLFQDGVLLGGVGVAGDAPAVTEFAAYSGAVGAGFGPTPAAPGVVVINGIFLPFVSQTTRPAGSEPGAFDGSFIVGPIYGPGPPPEGYLAGPTDGPIGGLSGDDVEGIVQAVIAEANQTRAVIRLPDGSRARFVIAVSDLDGYIIGLYRMPDSTIFSVDVAVAKARNVIYFSGSPGNPADLPGIPAGTAITNRTIGFGAQPFYPPGINYTQPGPFFNLYKLDTSNPCTQGSQPSNPNQNGIVFFPGSAPLYRNGALVGGLGVSGDGVDQDDFVTAAGAAGFPAPAGIRADQIVLRGQRLPYWDFPRNPTF